MKIAIGCDHGGVELKKTVIEHLQEKGIEVKDFGTYTEESCDYPEYGQKVAEEVVAKNYDFGIVICGTGIGISISANKVPGARAALCHDTFSAHATREHNNANILALGARVTGPGLALDIVDAFLGATFEGGRHERRIDKISEIEKKYSK
ncbi:MULTISPECIES: ribose 5-phosphate isomerase B [Clostridium]|uniref:Ribose 5-phosphate isomerase B n=1 Tax=Clostridium novyi (strain NT) TaxID=386415 RepID=A0Q307_CLONN|nr:MULTISPECIES: ribose 5-phosphate isomerase B [Clostridium]ABK62512.1 ribose 5-phosphate isomerase B [Clostridium novyi NT]KEH86367.1 ribose 5-phosphate isomerase [Clostridium novyi A str. 4540]KEH87020.1 ribose 5-phosphate isomerase [Clostridium novyi A str. NCTC 538]KEH91113.1 ribose 5-phosphate isomerase [Clostridium novyi A str. BKT29909]KEH92358.1 ribose 5-phosphate isomerase [Clostridium novyi A str. GD211209]